MVGRLSKMRGGGAVGVSGLQRATLAVAAAQSVWKPRWGRRPGPYFRTKACIGPAHRRGAGPALGGSPRSGVLHRHPETGCCVGQLSEYFGYVIDLHEKGIFDDKHGRIL